ncbi:hypothetical protein FISHEDRAFT_77724 [Fistulina hepatica ATCC 64428]|nr:hypothetical protein FISHEDRAFT_77724 [Fistulina hepatica ATCC 64428]
MGNGAAARGLHCDVVRVGTGSDLMAAEVTRSTPADHGVTEPAYPAAMSPDIAHRYIVSYAITPGSGEDRVQCFHHWYWKGYLAALSKVTGWASSERFDLTVYHILPERRISMPTDPDAIAIGLGNNATLANFPRHLALCKWASLDAFQSAEFAAATGIT